MIKLLALIFSYMILYMRLLSPGGARAVAAEKMALRQQLKPHRLKEIVRDPIQPSSLKLNARRDKTPCHDTLIQKRMSFLRKYLVITRSY